jgi:hypothetical protein
MTRAQKLSALVALVTINFLAVACGGQDNSSLMSPDIKEHPLHPPASDAGVSQDAGESSVPDAGTSTTTPVVCPPSGLPTAGDMMCGNHTKQACSGEYFIQDGECRFSCQKVDGEYVYNDELANDAARWCTSQ